MIDQALRLPKARLLGSLARRLHGTPPLAITLGSVALGLAAAGAAALGHSGWGLLLWLANRLLDGLDGEVARLSERQSDLGGYLDMLLDLLVYALIPIALVIHRPSPAAYLSLALLLAAFYLNVGSWMYLSALLEKRGRAAGSRFTSIAMPGGLIEGGETVLFYGLFLAFPAALGWLFGLMAALVTVTALQRVVWSVKVLREMPR
jgi:phosphatidylglycerophosphate synthase